MNNRTITFLISAVLASAALSSLLGNSITDNLDSFEGILRLLGLLAFALMLSKSNLPRQREYVSPIFFSIGLIIIGAMFKIMHWPWANLILISGLVSVPVIYSLRFVNKTTKSYLDILKVVSVNLNFIGIILSILHYPYGQETLNIAAIIFWIMFFVFAYRQYISKRLIER